MVLSKPQSSGSQVKNESFPKQAQLHHLHVITETGLKPLMGSQSYPANKQLG